MLPPATSGCCVEDFVPAYRPLAPQAPMPPVPEAYAATALALSQFAVATTRCDLDIAYGPLPEHRLDIFLPGEDGTERPVYISIHGGNWSHGYKEWLGFGAIPVVAAGAIYISLEYRLTGVAKHPAQLEDCLTAVAWIRDNIARYGGDPDRLFIGGHSAGAHLAAMVTLRRDLYPRFGLPEKTISACFPYCGIMDLRHGDIYTINPAVGPGDNLLASQADAEDASPICWTEGNTTPFFVSWGERDSPIMLLQGAPFTLALKAAPGRVESKVLAGFDHFYAHLDQLRPESYFNRVLLAWMFGDPETTPLPA